MGSYYIGIDSSNYRTSVALIDSDSRIIYEKAELLPVKQGERGLRQSTAFFMHSKELPGYISEMLRGVDKSEIKACGVSTRPRRVEGSYMPVFMAGENAAKILSETLEIPRYTFSHQEGHIAAICEELSSEAIVYHMSGGTSEILLCKEDELGYEVSRIGGTLDISIGQLIDRVGVAMGYGFPAGEYLDEIALNKFRIAQGYDLNIFPDLNRASKRNSNLESRFNRKGKISIKDGYFNLSGIETRMLRKIEEEPDEGVRISLISELFEELAILIYQSAEYLCEKYDIGDFYVAGGVASSKTLRILLECLSSEESNSNILFGEAALSGDNAVGIARLARRLYINDNPLTEII